jgi:hypothetical protein
MMILVGFGAPTVWLEPVTDEEYAQSPVDAVPWIDGPPHALPIHTGTRCLFEVAHLPVVALRAAARGFDRKYSTRAARSRGRSE